jgi:hypothetical protein
MRRMVLKRLVFGTLLVTFLVAEGLLVSYVHRTKARVNDLYRRAEAAAQRAELATQ